MFQQHNQEGVMEEHIREQEQIDKQHDVQQRQMQIEEVLYGCVIYPIAIHIDTYMLWIPNSGTVGSG